MIIKLYILGLSNKYIYIYMWLSSFQLSFLPTHPTSASFGHLLAVDIVMPNLKLLLPCANSKEDGDEMLSGIVTNSLSKSLGGKNGKHPKILYCVRG